LPWLSNSLPLAPDSPLTKTLRSPLGVIRQMVLPLGWLSRGP